ncbi:hypothetical protein HY636_03065 [Candidatus Woesearchaeota archaeon]|nr:hypothetical protein [Candidatus Woesearchaeota archaeon]
MNDLTTSNPLDGEKLGDEYLCMCGVDFGQFGEQRRDPSRRIISPRTSRDVSVIVIVDDGINTRRRKVTMYSLDRIADESLPDCVYPCDFCALSPEDLMILRERYDELHPDGQPQQQRKNPVERLSAELARFYTKGRSILPAEIHLSDVDGMVLPQRLAFQVSQYGAGLEKAMGKDTTERIFDNIGRDYPNIGELGIKGVRHIREAVYR